MRFHGNDAISQEESYIQGGPNGQIVVLSWLMFRLFHLLPGSAFALGKLAAKAELVFKVAEHNRSKSAQPNIQTRKNSLYLAEF